MHFSLSALATLALAAAAASVNAQVVGDIPQAPAPGQGVTAPSQPPQCGSAAADATFQLCLNNARTLRAMNCAQFERTQGYDFFHCACENAKTAVQCYDQCSTQPGLKLIAQSEQTSYCDAAARLKPASATTTRAPGATPAVDIVTATVTKGPAATGAPVKDNGAAGVSAKVGSAAAVGGVVAFVAAALA